MEGRLYYPRPFSGQHQAGVSARSKALEPAFGRGFHGMDRRVARALARSHQYRYKRRSPDFGYVSQSGLLRQLPHGVVAPEPHSGTTRLLWSTHIRTFGQSWRGSGSYRLGGPDRKKKTLT